MLGEFFAARAGDVDGSLVADGPHGRLPTVEAKGLTPVTIATLGEILGAGSYDNLVRRTAEGPEREGREGEDGDVGVMLIPGEIRDALATVDDVGAVANRWASTEELSLDEWQVEDALEVLREVRELARRTLEPPASSSGTGGRSSAPGATSRERIDIHDRATTRLPEQPRDRRSRILVPKSSEPFTVVVARTTADARYAYRKLRRETTRFTFDLRARNVITISDTGLTHTDKVRLRRAMQHLRRRKGALSTTPARAGMSPELVAEPPAVRG